MGQTAQSIGANVFQFFTRNPRGGAARPLDPGDVGAFRDFADAHAIGPILAHAPYTLNAAGADARVRAFAESVMIDDLLRLEATPGALYNFHPGSHVGQGAEAGIALIASMLGRVVAAVRERARVETPHTTILLETMAGKGSEIGRTFEELRAIIDQFESHQTLGTPHQALGTPHQALSTPHQALSTPHQALSLGVCLDTCHVWDGGYDIAGDLDGVLATFDRVLGLGRLKAIHLNDSLNGLGSHKDRHAGIGKGKIGLDALVRVINHPRLRALPFYLETPCDLDGYRAEIALLRRLRN